MIVAGGERDFSPEAAISGEYLLHLDDHVLGVGVLAEDGEVWSDVVHHRLALPCEWTGRIMRG